MTDTFHRWILCIALQKRKHAHRPSEGLMCAQGIPARGVLRARCPSDPCLRPGDPELIRTVASRSQFSCGLAPYSEDTARQVEEVEAPANSREGNLLRTSELCLSPRPGVGDADCGPRN